MKTQVLIGDEPKVLHDKEKIWLLKNPKAGEGSKSEHHNAASEIPPTSQTASTSSIDPPVVSEYDTDMPHFSPVIERSPKACRPNPKAKLRKVFYILLIFFKMREHYQRNIINIFSYLYSALDSASANPPTTQEVHHEHEALITEATTVTITTSVGEMHDSGYVFDEIDGSTPQPPKRLEH